jgi:hypothetical protein
MQRGILRQFRGARGMLFDPPTSVSPTHDCFGLCFKVIEATWNPTEEAPARGGFCSPEGFHFSNM